METNDLVEIDGIKVFFGAVNISDDTVNDKGDHNVEFVYDIHYTPFDEAKTESIINNFLQNVIKEIASQVK